MENLVIGDPVKLYADVSPTGYDMDAVLVALPQQLDVDDPEAANCRVVEYGTCGASSPCSMCTKWCSHGSLSAAHDKPC